MRLEFKGSNNSKISSTATDCPIQVRVLLPQAPPLNQALMITEVAVRPLRDLNLMIGQILLALQALDQGTHHPCGVRGHGAVPVPHGRGRDVPPEAARRHSLIMQGRV